MNIEHDTNVSGTRYSLDYSPTLRRATMKTKKKKNILYEPLNYEKWFDIKTSDRISAERVWSIGHKRNVDIDKW